MTGTPFQKMHGLGNDFVVFDARAHPVSIDAAMARAIADRRTGIGCDQLITIEPPQRPDTTAFMRIRNADGQEVSACGNGTRCIAWWLAETGAGAQGLRIETNAGLLLADVVGDHRVTVDMGAVGLDWQQVPLARQADTLHVPDVVAGRLNDPVAVSIGNPHCVFVVEDAEAVPIDVLGPEIELHPMFPEHTNVEVISRTGADRLRMRVWERGVGVTRACGTGACASLVAAHRRGLTGRRGTVTLDGGDLEIEWLDNGHVTLTGPVAHAFSGEWSFA